MLKKIKERIEKIIPMSLGSLVMFALVIYLLVIVGKTMISNYAANKQIEEQQMSLQLLEQKIIDLQNQINYEKTASFREKEARSKLGYKLPGENVIALPIDTEVEKSPDSELVAQKVMEPNYSLWWQYFFGQKTK
jgi:cell division protein FtsB